MLPLCRFVDRLGIAGHFGTVLVFGALVFYLQLLSGWPPEWLPLAIIAPPYVVFRLVPALYQSSIETLSYRTDARAVGPLMDAVAFKLRRPRETKVRRSDRWIEGLVLRRLPLFLDRMPAGDGPALTREQSNTLRWLVDRPDYYPYFLQPGLHEKIEGVLDAGRRLPSGV